MNKQIGKALSAKRKELKLSVEDVAKQIFIKPIYVQMLEEGTIESFPSQPQAMGFLKNYASFLSIDLNAFEKEEPAELVQEASFVEEDSEQAANQTEELEQFETNRIQDESPEIEIKKTYIESDHDSIGKKLNKRREILGASIEEVSKHLKIPAHYIRLIEKNEFDLFSSPVQARGMLLSYSEFLSVDKQWILDKFGERLQENFNETREPSGPYDEKNEAKQVSSMFWVWFRDVLSVDMFVVIVSILLVVGFGIWGVRRVVMTRDDIPVADLYVTPTMMMDTISTETAEETLDPNATPINTLEVNDNQLSTLATSTPIPEAPTGTTINMKISISQRTYLEVTVDGEEKLRKRVAPNTEWYFFGTDSIEVVAGNAAALTIEYNETVYDSLGIFGQVFEAQYFVNRVSTPPPPPTITPIPTLTPEVTPEEEMIDE